MPGILSLEFAIGAVSMRLLGRLISLTPMLIVGLIGLFFALSGLGIARSIVSALLTGVFVRQDELGATGEVRISRATDPIWFWDNLKAWSLVAFVLTLIGLSILLPVTVCMRQRMRSRKAAPRPPS
jgi:hypothetical protein